MIFEYNKDDGIKFAAFLYEDATIYLDRKYRLYEFLKMEAVLYRNMKNYYKPISGKAAMLIPR